MPRFSAPCMMPTMPRAMFSGISLQQEGSPRNRLMITTWENKAAWEAWKISPERQTLVNTIAPMLDAPESVQIYQVNID